MKHYKVSVMFESESGIKDEEFVPSYEANVLVSSDIEGFFEVEDIEIIDELGMPVSNTKFTQKELESVEDQAMDLVTANSHYYRIEEEGYDYF